MNIDSISISNLSFTIIHLYVSVTGNISMSPAYSTKKKLSYFRRKPVHLLTQCMITVAQTEQTP